MACVYTFPATSAWLVAFSEQSPGRAGPGWELARHGNLLNQLEVLPAGGRHMTHTWGAVLLLGFHTTVLTLHQQ